MPSVSLASPRFLTPCAVFSVLFAAAPAKAAEWILLSAEGEKPSRVAYYAQPDTITDFFDPDEVALAIKSKSVSKMLDKMSIQQVRVTEILESAAAPHSVEYIIQFRCSNGAMRVTRNFRTYRENVRNENGPLTDWQKTSAQWQDRAQLLACDRSRWQAAQAADVKRNGPPTALTKLGLLFVGEHAGAVGLADLTWSKFWPDGKRTPLTWTKSQEELDALEESALAALDEGVKDSAEIMRSSKQKIEASDKESAFFTNVAKTFQEKTYGKAFQDVMFGMRGWTLEQLNETLGYAAEERQSGDALILVYRSGADERVTSVVSPYGHLLTTGVSRTCQWTFVLREGGSEPGPRLVDYEMQGENCDKSTLLKSIKRQ